MGSRFVGMFLFLAVAWLSVSVQAQAGELAKVDNPQCDYRFEGEVKPGDAELFDTRNLRDWKGLCLNSPGGSFVEGLAIEQKIEGMGVRTVVLKGDECYSSCALIFMGGGSFEDRLIPMRTLEIGGRLGFHAPYSMMKEASYTASEVDAAYYIGLQSVSKMISLASYAIPNTMMIEILNTPPDKLYMIDSAAKANTLGIDLDGVEHIEWTKKNLLQACATRNGWDRAGDYYEPSVALPLPKGGTEYRWGGFGDEASGYCVVRVSKDLKRAYIVPTYYDGDPEIRDVDLLPLKESDAFAGVRDTGLEQPVSEEAD